MFCFWYHVHDICHHYGIVLSFDIGLTLSFSLLFSAIECHIKQLASEV